MIGFIKLLKKELQGISRIELNANKINYLNDILYLHFKILNL